MKKIEELYQEILQDEGLKGEFAQAAKDNQIEAFLQKNDCNATLSEVQKFAKKKQSEMGLLSDTELDAAAGGANIREVTASIFLEGARCAVFAGVSARGSGVGSREGAKALLCHDFNYKFGY